MCGVHMNSESQLDPGGQKAVVKVSKSYMGLRMTSDFGGALVALYIQRGTLILQTTTNYLPPYLHDTHKLPPYLHDTIHDLTGLVKDIQ